MALPDDLWSELHARFAPEKPADERQRAPRDDYNRVQELRRRLSLTLRERQHHLLTGPIGSGKSTELRHLALQLAGPRDVLYLDLVKHFQDVVKDDAAIGRLSAVEVLGLIGLGALRVATETHGLDMIPEAADLSAALTALDDREQASRPQIDAGSLAAMIPIAFALVGGAGPALVFLQAVAGAVRWTLPLGGRKAPSDQDARAKALASATDAIVTRITRETARPLLVVVDGLDRVRDAATFDGLFCRSGLLAPATFDAVYTSDLHLRQEFEGRIPFQCTYLGCLRVLDQADPTRSGPDTPFFREVVQRRLADLSYEARHLLRPEQIDLLAYRSGGQIRDFMRLIREVVLAAWGSEVPASNAQVNAAIDAVRRQRESGITREELDVLASVRDDPRHERPAGELTNLLLLTGRLLPYPNQSTWYYPHPLLLMSVLRDRIPRTAQSDSNAS